MNAVECPVCFGEGGFDQRDSNALLREMLDDRALGFVGGLGEDWLPCSACEGTGLVGEDEARAIRGRAVAAVDQALARLRERGRLPRV